MRLRHRGRLRGIVLSTELILLIAGTITLATVVLIGLSKHATAYASSSKALLKLTWAEVQKVASRLYAVSVLVVNQGSVPVTIKEIGFEYVVGGSICKIYKNGLSITVNPGEVKMISTAVSTCSCGWLTAYPLEGSDVSAYVIYEANYHYGKDGIKCKVESPE